MCTAIYTAYVLSLCDCSRCTGLVKRPDLAVHRFARLMLQNRPIPVYGDGSSRRDYTYISDVLAGIVAAMNYKTSLYEVIKCGQ